MAATCFAAMPDSAALGEGSTSFGFDAAIEELLPCEDSFFELLARPAAASSASIVNRRLSKP